MNFKKLGVKMIRKVLLLIFVVLMAHAKVYEGCGSTKKEALVDLSGNINSSVSDSFISNIKQNDDSFSKEVTSKSNVSTSLDLVDISYKTKENNHLGNYCAYVDSSDQIKHTQKTYTSIKTYHIDVLPKNETDQINTLGKWIEKIDKTLNLLNVFSDALNDKQKNDILKRHKIFIDIRTELVLKQKDAIWKACAQDKSEAYVSLNKTIFSKKDEGGFWTKILSSSEQDNREVISNDIFYIQEKGLTCAVLEKEKLLTKVMYLFDAVKDFSTEKLPKDELEKYTQLQIWFLDIQKVQDLVVLFPNKFTKLDHKLLVDEVQLLKKYQATLIPQYILFQIAGNKVSVLIDGNKEHKVNIVQK